MSTSRDVREDVQKQRWERKKEGGVKRVGRALPSEVEGSSQDNCYCKALMVNPGDPASRVEMCLT